MTRQYHVHVLVDGLRVRHYWTDFGPAFEHEATIDAGITDKATNEGKSWQIDIYDPIANYTHVLASDPVSPKSMPIMLADWKERRS